MQRIVRLPKTVTRLTPVRARDRHSNDGERSRFPSLTSFSAEFLHSLSTGVLAFDVQRSGRMSLVKQKKLVKRVRKPSAKALAEKRREYAAKFFPYIEKVARRLARRLPAHVEIDDLISSGVIGLMEAAERFDPSRVDRFEAFAEFRIRGAMLDDLRSRDTLSRDMRRLSNELREATRRLESQLGRSPDPEELAEQLGLEADGLYARQQ